MIQLSHILLLLLLFLLVFYLLYRYHRYIVILVGILHEVMIWASFFPCRRDREGMSRKREYKTASSYTMPTFAAESKDTLAASHLALLDDTQDTELQANKKLKNTINYGEKKHPSYHSVLGQGEKSCLLCRSSAVCWLCMLSVSHCRYTCSYWCSMPDDDAERALFFCFVFLSLSLLRAHLSLSVFSLLSRTALASIGVVLWW